MTEPLFDERLFTEPNIWFASTRRDGRPHLVPIWFAFVEGRFYVCTTLDSVKVRNVRRDARVMVSLESGTKPVFCEGTARVIERPYPAEVNAAFVAKFDWELDSEPEYDALVEVTPTRWLRGGPEAATP